MKKNYIKSKKKFIFQNYCINPYEQQLKDKMNLELKEYKKGLINKFNDDLNLSNSDDFNEDKKKESRKKFESQIRIQKEKNKLLKEKKIKKKS